MSRQAKIGRWFFIFVAVSSYSYSSELYQGKKYKKTLSEQGFKTHHSSEYRDPFIGQSERSNSYPNSEAVNALTETQKENKQDATELRLLQSELIEIKYAKAQDIAELLKRENSVGMLSELGRVSYDERTNVVLIKELPEYISSIKAIISRLDIPVKQVQIEARIAIVNEGNIEELGVRWGGRTSNKYFAIGGSIEGTSTSSTSELSEDSVNIKLEDFLNVNLGNSSSNASSIAFQVAKLGTSSLLDLELSALQAESKAEVISSPRLLTTNKKPSYIEQGTEIPYLEATENGVATVKFRKAVLSLMVTPQITPDNKLILDLHVTQDRLGQVIKTGNGESIAIDTQRIDTQVLVNDGETIVLGGIFQHTNISRTDKVPLLADIPLIGRLFQRSYENREKRELLIFVTPQIMMDSVLTN